MQEKERRQVESLSKGYIVAVFLIIGILLAKLGWLQLVETEYYTSRADAQRTRLMTVTAARGDISTSDGVVLVTDHSSYQVTVDYLAVRENGAYKQEEIELLASLLQDEALTAEKIMEICDANRGYLYKPIVIKKDLDIETVSRIEARRDKLPGVTIESVPERTYIYGTLAGHLLGYTGLVSQEELNAQMEAQDSGDENATNFKMGDYVGKIGVEKSYDTYLRGVNGYRQVEVNAAGRPVSDVQTVDPQNGHNLILTIDYDLQVVLENAMDETIARLQSQSRSDKAGAGAGVLIDVNSGKILAMVSRPDDNITQQNRAIQGRYLPGSTFKPVTAVAALESGAITDTERIYNPGRYWNPPYIKTTAPIGYYNLYNGMALSDNVYFQELGHRAGIDNIAKYGAMLGLDGSTGIDLPYESSGTRATEGLPTPEKREQYQNLAVANQEAFWDKKIAEAEAAFAQELAMATTEEEKAKIERRPFTDEEIAQLWQDDSVYAKVALVLIYTGMRVRELKHVVYDDSIQAFKGGLKTSAGRDRIIPVRSKIMALTAVQDAVAGDSDANYYEKMKRCLKKYNHLTHDCRVTFATRYKDADPTAIKLILGHKIDDITKGVYTKYAPAELLAIVESLNF